MTDAPTEQPQNGAAAAAISNLTVHLLSEYTGRGPTRARTHLSGDLVAVVLQDAMTRAERSLVEQGEHERVLDTRQAFQRGMREDLAAGVARITGREVVAFSGWSFVNWRRQRREALRHIELLAAPEPAPSVAPTRLRLVGLAPTS